MIFTKKNAPGRSKMFTGINLMIYVNVFVSSCADIQHTSFHERAGFVQNGTICCWYAIFLIFVFDGNCKALWVTWARHRRNIKIKKWEEIHLFWLNCGLAVLWCNYSIPSKQPVSKQVFFTSVGFVWTSSTCMNIVIHVMGN